MITVLGAKGLVGSAVMDSLAQAGVPVVGTSRSPGGEGFLRLELADRSTWDCLPKGTSAVLVAGGASGSLRCREDPHGTRQINVFAVLEFAKFAEARGCFPVIVSSSYVFDGSRPDFGSSDAPCPQCEYGRQKADMEKLVTSELRSAALVRMTKVFGTSNPLVSAWRKALIAGNHINVAGDARLSPLRSDFVAHALADMLVSPVPGLWQLSAADDLSWADVARSLAERCGVSGDAVRTCRLADLDPLTEFTPTRGSLKVVWPSTLDSQRSVLAVERLLENICASS